MIVFTIDGLRLSSGLNARENHFARSRRVKAERRATKVHWQAHGLHLYLEGLLTRGPLVVTMTRLGPGTLDDDNAVGAMKGVRDEIASLMGITDRDPRVTWVVKQQRQKGWGVRVEIAAKGEVAA